ncbi:MAG TPA: tripartite tricarboxylate transporter substrate binding protein [Burkholderiales bacterium]|nr:tripartite tricarboxylate transporter substrate binding protein [Burkholderiales bacterium]
MQLKLVCAALCALAMLPPGGAHAQSYPAKTVRVITPFPAGSGPDSALRVIVDKVSRQWGQQVLVENRPGANGFIALGAAKAAPADGYTLAQASSAQLSTHRLVFKSMPYDPAKDFDAVIPLFRNHFFIVVPAAASWKNVGELVAAAKAKPNGLAYGSEFVGSPGHLGAALLEASTGTQMTHAPFKETSQLFTAVGTGDVQWAFGTAGTAGAAVRSGKARLLALAAPRRLAAFPDVPTVAESGGPAGFEVAAWTGLLVPKHTPKAIVDQVNRDVAKAVAEPDVRERFASFGYEAWPLSPARMSAAIEADVRRYADTIKRLKLQLD